MRQTETEISNIAISLPLCLRREGKGRGRQLLVSLWICMITYCKLCLSVLHVAQFPCFFSFACQQDFSASGCLKSALASLKLNLHDERNTHTHTHPSTLAYNSYNCHQVVTWRCPAAHCQSCYTKCATSHVLPAATHNVNVLLPANYTQYCNKRTTTTTTAT